jgi:hypothetical protein
MLKHWAPKSYRDNGSILPMGKLRSRADSRAGLEDPGPSAVTVTYIASFPCGDNFNPGPSFPKDQGYLVTRRGSPSVPLHRWPPWRSPSPEHMLRKCLYLNSVSRVTGIPGVGGDGEGVFCPISTWSGIHSPSELMGLGTWEPVSPLVLDGMNYLPL